MFLGATMTLLSVMMVYKYWDSITKDDLEYAVNSGRAKLWHSKGNLINEFGFERFTSELPPSRTNSARETGIDYSTFNPTTLSSEDTAVALSNKSFFY